MKGTRKIKQGIARTGLAALTGFAGYKSFEMFAKLPEYFPAEIMSKDFINYALLNNVLFFTGVGALVAGGKLCCDAYEDFKGDAKDSAPEQKRDWKQDNKHIVKGLKKTQSYIDNRQNDIAKLTLDETIDYAKDAGMLIPSCKIKKLEKEMTKFEEYDLIVNLTDSVPEIGYQLRKKDEDKIWPPRKNEEFEPAFLGKGNDEKMYFIDAEGGTPRLFVGNIENDSKTCEMKRSNEILEWRLGHEYHKGKWCGHDNCQISITLRNHDHISVFNCHTRENTGLFFGADIRRNDDGKITHMEEIPLENAKISYKKPKTKMESLKGKLAKVAWNA